MMVFAGSVPLGNLLTGGLAHVFGAPVALFIEASVSMIVVIVGLMQRKPAVKNLAESTQIYE